MKRRTLRWKLGLLLGLGVPIAAVACEYLTVRDAAFQEPRDVHRLVLFTSPEDADGDQLAAGLTAGLKAGLEGGGKDLNLELAVVNIAAEGIAWGDYGIPGPPPSTPVTALVGTDQRSGKSFFVHHWIPAPATEELRMIVQSPLRDRLSELLPKQTAVLVHAVGTENPRPEVPEMLAKVEAEWDQREKYGVSRLTLDRADPAEAILLSFLGIPREGPDWVAVFFGRSKAMDPWIGEEIEEVQINHQIETLIGECSCLMTAGSLGVDVPMVWTEAMDNGRVFLREAEEEESPLAAGLKNTRLLGGPAVILGLLLFGAPAVGAGVYFLRQRRSALPVTAPLNR